MTQIKPIRRPSSTPWILDSDEDGESAILSSDGGEVGCIWANDGHGLANARLIAAAPDLLAALQSAMQFIGDNWETLTSDDPNWQCAEPGWMEPARAAITKATNPNP